MKDIGQHYQSLLDKELDSLERERRKEYEYLFDDLVRQGMVRKDIHIEQALALEGEFMLRFTIYGITKYKQLNISPEVDMNMLEKIFRYETNYFFGRSLQRMLGIISNVRGSIPAAYAQEFLEKVKSEALQSFEITKFVEER
jgi:hypothetical protein